MTKRILCTCEDVTLEDIENAVAQGFGDLETLKRYTGFGTGSCQGKQCMIAAIEHLARVRGMSPAELRLPTIRQPIVPLTLEQLASRPPLPDSSDEAEPFAAELPRNSGEERTP